MTEPSNSPSAPSGITEFKPTQAQVSRLMRTNLILYAVIGPLLVVSATLQLVSGNTVGAIIVFGALIIALPVGFVLGKRNASRALLRFGDGTYELRQTPGGKNFSAADVDQVVALGNARFAMWPGAPMLLIVGPTKRLCLLTGYLWNTEQLDAVARDLGNRGVTLVDKPEALTGAQLRGIDKRWISFWEAHPIAIGLTAGLAIVLIVAAAVLIAFAVLR
ncbi:hypothetical protein M2152_000324 [Microbacteriaceae bacterium SG_E_30_P1]|uniref:PH (Pleckstrin Homology) domain-containing protein n=1 Tax=Antiquaquibacter oligotrophicus TaxID=2880260 RepID=A0ABT6KJG6_9MICO|nr:hypothetical protein [Antiquaquibacter oligotrophicus]MDH6180142.1 hypothetical protein [Antiquaquibacter oligotrophicus]UDF14106.1 hypothetical protein LH407_04410 [Antiquaquibacter oligotrophicus]